MKKYLALLLVLVMVLSLAACGYKGPLELPPGNTQGNVGDVSTAPRTPTAKQP